jgi:hypothetical protein
MREEEGGVGETDTLCSSVDAFELSTSTAALYLGDRRVAGTWRCVREPGTNSLLLQVSAKAKVGGGVVWLTKLTTPAK